VANWLARILPAWAAKGAEGDYRPGPYLLSDGWLSAKAGRFWNFWQMGYSVQPYGDAGAMVEACISAYAQTIAMCPGDHWETTADGGRRRVTTSALSRVIRVPNDYQTISDFLLNLTRALYERGEGFAYAARNARNEITELHLMKYGQALVGTDGSIYYHLSGNEIAERRFALSLSLPVPARDVLHVRLHTPQHPLKGVSPILASALERAMAGAALNQQVAFYLNQARPSFMLETDQQLTKEQTDQLRIRWNEQTQGENAGGTPILAWGLKAKQVSMSAADAALADMLKIANESIALAFRMPLAVLGLGATTFANTEALMSSWKASGLGFALNHIEEAFGLLFRLKGQPDEYLEFDTEALMRSNFKDRIEGLARGVISGIYAPDEARNKEGLPTVADGHGAQPRVQQQVVPLSYASELKPPTPQVSPAPNNPDEGSDDDADQRTAEDFSREIERAIAARHPDKVH
jgi:HK97 family phage portal protein